MTAPHRAALRALIVGDDKRPINSFDAADRILAAGWMPRPEPGSAEWIEMIARMVRSTDEHVYIYVADGMLRAALYPEEKSNG